jgi:ethanolamine transporter
MMMDAGRFFGTMNMIFNKAIMVIMSCGIVIGAVDYLCGNRWGLGKRFTEGFEAFCPLFLMMGGILAIVPLVEVMRHHVK